MAAVGSGLVGNPRTLLADADHTEQTKAERSVKDVLDDGRVPG